MKQEMIARLQDAAIVLFVGLAIPPAIGFGTGLWMSKDKSDQRVNEAVLNTKTGICLAQFSQAPNYLERLKVYKSLDYSAKIVFLEKGGWGRMPGEDKAVDSVRDACGNKIDAMAQK